MNNIKKTIEYILDDIYDASNITAREIIINEKD